MLALPQQPLQLGALAHHGAFAQAIPLLGIHCPPQLLAQVPLPQGYLPDYPTKDLFPTLDPQNSALFLPSFWKVVILYQLLLLVSPFGG